MSSLLGAGLPVPTSTVDAVAGYLESAILYGDLKGGQPLPESVLAEKFGFARHTVRAALARVQFMGLVESTANKGWSVRLIDVDALREINFVRSGIESFAYSTLTRNPKPLPQPVADALRAIESTEATDSIGEIMHREFALHSALVDAVSNPRLSSIHSSLLLESRLGLVQSEKDTNATSADVDHWKATHLAIAAAIEGGDEATLVGLMADRGYHWMAALADPQSVS